MRIQCGLPFGNKICFFYCKKASRLCCQMVGNPYLIAFTSELPVSREQETIGD